MSKKWQFSKVWNESLLAREERELKPRDYLWASELGKAPVDVWLKMKGTPETNPPNARSLRKFEAGNIWEWIVKLILLRSGILQAEQKPVAFQYEGLLKVTGRIDFIAGGKPDYEKARKEIESLALPEVFIRAGQNIIEYFEREFPDGLESKIIEVKSLSAFMFELFEEASRTSRNHRLQLFHYLKSENQESGELVYICRDDCRMTQVEILKDSGVEDEYRKQIELLTANYRSDVQPPIEKCIVFDEDTGKFAKNWHVAYSAYLTMLYGFKDQQEFDDMYMPVASRWNRVMGRCKIAEMRRQWLAGYDVGEEDVKQDKIEGTRKRGPQYIWVNAEKVEIPIFLQKGYNMTEKNLAAIEEMSISGFSVTELLPKFSLKGDGEDDENSDE